MPALDMRMVPLFTLELNRQTHTKLTPNVYIPWLRNSVVLQVVADVSEIPAASFFRDFSHWRQQVPLKRLYHGSWRWRHLSCNTESESPVTGLEWPTGFQEVKVARFHDNGTGWWQGCQPYSPAAFTPRKYTWYSFLLEAESTPGRITSLKNTNDTTGNRTRDLPVCSVVP